MNLRLREKAAISLAVRRLQSDVVFLGHQPARKLITAICQALGNKTKTPGSQVWLSIRKYL